MGKTPKDVIGAFAPDRATAGGIPLCMVTPNHIFALERLESPLLDEGRPISLRDALQALVVLANSGEEALEIAADAARLEAEVERIGGKLPLSRIKEVVRSIGAHIMAAFAPAVPAGEADPLAEPPPATGQAAESAGC